jgi:hypothetical protein
VHEKGLLVQDCKLWNQVFVVLIWSFFLQLIIMLLVPSQFWISIDHFAVT